MRKKSKNKRARYYNINSSMGNDWAIYHIFIGIRDVGKSYSVTDFFCRQKKKKKDKVKIYWLRLSDTSTKLLLQNKANKLVDPDLQRKYDLDLTTKGPDVYDHGKLFMSVYPLTSAGKAKGLALYDKDYDGWYYLALDEFVWERGERQTIDIVYNLKNLIETIARKTKNKIKIFLMANNCTEASAVLKAFNFMPIKPGRYYLKKRRCVIDWIPKPESYDDDVKGSAPDLLSSNDEDTNYSNDVKRDIALLDTKRCKKPVHIIKFASLSDWYTLYDNGVIKRWNKEKLPPDSDWCMKRYLSSFYSDEIRNMVVDMWDARAFRFDSLITLTYFKSCMEKIKK